MKPLILLSPALLLAACSVGPDYKPPKLDTPINWRSADTKVNELIQTKWWERFGDKELNSLVEKALAENVNLHLAAARIEQFRALYGVSRAGLYPELSALGGFTRTAPSESGVVPTSGDPSNTYSLDGALRWEIDLWGRIRRSNEAARAEFLAEEAGARGVLVTVVTAVVQTYIELRGLDQRLDISKNTLKSRAESLRIARERFANGVVSELDIKQAESEYLSVELAIPELELAIGRRENLLSVLLGGAPQSIARGRTIDELNSSVMIPASLPADIVKNRPDLIEAEERLKGATARIGVAIAEYYPKLSMTGLLGFLSADFSDWLKSESNEWQVAPRLGLPVFTAGRLENQVLGAKASAKQAEEAYKLRTLEALREVEDALIGYEKTTKKRDLLDAQVKILQGYNSLSKQRYDEGQSDYLDVLDAQRNLFASELNLTNAEVQVISEYINLFKALGGGWVTSAQSASALKKVIEKKDTAVKPAVG
jgi:multidrug efflux system outer membrane protein